MLSKQVRKGFMTILLVVICCTALLSCAPPTKVDVIERETVDRNVEIDRIGGSLVRYVQPGDTLYSIAFVMNLDPKEVAAWNGVNDTADLQIGQRLRLTKPIDYVAPSEPTLPPTSKPYNDRRIVVEPIEDNPSTVKENIPTAPTNSSTTEIPSQPVIAAQTPKQSVTNTVNISTWSWPVTGNIVRRFSQSQGQHGIDIQGKPGQAVLSSNAGEVVYVGNGLKGYGNLIIIKHSDIFLSAYAHNSEIYVRDGEIINARQRIGSVGINRNKQTALHFQIRKNGQPVNPLEYLDKKG